MITDGEGKKKNAKKKKISNKKKPRTDKTKTG